MNWSRVHLRKAVEDLLREYEITLKDLLDAMDEERDSVMSSLLRVASLTEEELMLIERKLKTREINYVIFVIQTFYIINQTGLYKNLVVIPERDYVMEGRKASFDGLAAISKALGLSIE
jgi:hypothetical protein